MGKITCSECDFGGCSDSCLKKHAQGVPMQDYSCHNKLCPLHKQFPVTVRHHKFIRRGKPCSSARREPQKRARSTSPTRPDDKWGLPRVMNRFIRRRDTGGVDDNRGRGPHISVRYVRVGDDDDNGGPGPSTAARVRRGTRYVRPKNGSDSCDCDSGSCSSDSDEGGGMRWENGGPSSLRQHASNAPTGRPPFAAYSGFPRPSTYPSGPNNNAGTSGRNDYGARESPRAPSPPLKTNWRRRP